MRPTFIEGHRNVLAFGAHPDDLEVGAGGTLARFVADGATVTMVVVSVSNQFEVRLAEAKAGAARIGADLRIVFGAGTSRIEDLGMHELVARFDRLVDELAPDLVISHGAENLHWDHHLVHRATLSALRRTRCDVLTYDASPALGANARTIGPCLVDISATIETKLEAIAAHASQFTPDAVAGRRDAARALGRLCGAAYAESFEVLRLHV